MKATREILESGITTSTINSVNFLVHACKIVAIMFSYLLNKNQQGITGIKSGIEELIMIIIMIMIKFV